MWTIIFKLFWRLVLVEWWGFSRCIPWILAKLLHLSKGFSFQLSTWLWIKFNFPLYLIHNIEVLLKRRRRLYILESNFRRHLSRFDSESLTVNALWYLVHCLACGEIWVRVGKHLSAMLICKVFLHKPLIIYRINLLPLLRCLSLWVLLTLSLNINQRLGQLGFFKDELLTITLPIN